MNTDILDLMTKHEFAISQLYDLFSALFSTHQDFWKTYAIEELRHAGWLEKLKSGSNINKVQLNQKLKAPPIKLSIEFIESQLTKARTGKMTLLEALSAARDIESALIERQFAKIGDITSLELRPIIKDLATETERHLKDFIKEIEAEKVRVH